VESIDTQTKTHHSKAANDPDASQLPETNLPPIAIRRRKDAGIKGDVRRESMAGPGVGDLMKHSLI
jgi:hypothetical protein